MSNEPSVSVFLIAPTLLRWGLQRLLGTAGGQISVAGFAESTADAASDIETQFPDVVVVDADSCSPAEIRTLYERTSAKIVAVGSKPRPNGPSTGIQAWVEKRASPASFVRTVVGESDGIASPEHAASALRMPQPARETETRNAAVQALTRKQRLIALAIASNPGAPAKVVADKLHISEHTLRNHLTEIYARLGVTGRTHLQAELASKPWLVEASL
jgi:two-component system nitrate/nitrite response regulator NarL